MKSIRCLLVGTLIVSSAALVAPGAAAGGSSQHPLNRIGHSLASIRLYITKALAISTSPFEKPIALDSEACGAVSLTTASACEVIADSACLSTCQPAAFTLSAYNECASFCDASATLKCKLDCNPGCKSECLDADCDFDAVLACEVDCQGGCGAICAAKAAAEQIDATGCEIACGTTCSSHCSAASSVNDVDHCGVQCGASCQAQCTAEANMDCQIACQTELFEDKIDTCVASCGDEGALYCDGVHVDTLNLDDCIKDLTDAGILVAGG